MAKGVLPSQRLREAVASEWLTAGAYRIAPESIQPASLDLRLGEHAWALRCSFLPDSGSTVEQKIEGLAFEQIDLRDGVTLERDRPYLVPLIEQLAPARRRAREGQPEELDRAPRRVHARAHRPQPPLRRDRRRLPRQALPGGRPALVRDPRADGPRAQPGAPARRRRAPRDDELAQLHASHAAALPRLGRRCRARSCRSAAACSSASTCRARPSASSATARRRTACRSTSRRSASSRGGTSGSPSTPRRTHASCSSPRSSTCCCRPRA